MELIIHRSEKKQGNYIKIADIVFSDLRLSFQDIGLLCVLLKCRDKGDISEEIMEVEEASYNAAAFRTSLRNLQLTGYVTKNRLNIYNDKSGREELTWVYTVYDSPDSNPDYNAETEKELSATEHI